MMTLEQQLQLQAYLDGELAAGEAQQVAAWLEKDREAGSLVGELNATKSLLAGNETELRVPESREFYWSRIALEIERAEKADGAKPQPSWLASWTRWLAPVAGAAFLAISLAVTGKLSLSGTKVIVFNHDGQEIEIPLEETSVMSFRSDTEGVSVVWISN